VVHFDQPNLFGEGRPAQCERIEPRPEQNDLLDTPLEGLLKLILGEAMPESEVRAYPRRARRIPLVNAIEQLVRIRNTNQLLCITVDVDMSALMHVEMRGPGRGSGDRGSTRLAGLHSPSFALLPNAAVQPCGPKRYASRYPSGDAARVGCNGLLDQRRVRPWNRSSANESSSW
jgi:hypothetical protein